MKNKIQRIIATILSVLLISGIVAPVNAGAQNLPDEKDFSYAYADQLDLRLLEGFIFGADDQALSAAQLAGVQQAWRTFADNSNNSLPVTSNIDVTVLNGLTLDLGSLPINLVGPTGLLNFVLPDAGVGVLREYVHSPIPLGAHAAAGLVSNDGGLTLTQPGDGGNLNVNLLSLLGLSNTSVSDLVIDRASLELGALSAVAKKPDTHKFDPLDPTCTPDLTVVEYDNLPNSKLGVDHSIIDPNLDLGGVREGESDGTFCSAYQVSDAKVVIRSPLVENLLEEQIRPLVETLSLTLNGLLGAGGPLSDLNIGLTIPIVNTQIGTNITAKAEINIDQILEDLISTPLQDDPDSPLVIIDLKTGLIEVNLEELHSGTPNGLNGLDPNTPLINTDPGNSDIDKILDTITSLLTDSPSTNSNGLMAALDRVLKGTEVNGVKQGGLYSTELTITAGVTAKTLLGDPNAVGDITLISTLGALLNSDADAVDTKAKQELDPYGSYVLNAEGPVMTLLGLLLGGLVKDILGAVGLIVDGLLFTSPSLLDTLLTNASTSVLNNVLGSLSPVLRNVLQPLANIIINRQKVDALSNGVLFTVSAVEVNVATLLPDASLISLPLATASVMAQNWDPIEVDFNVAKVGNGRNLHQGDYTYDTVCKANQVEIFKSTYPNNYSYAESHVGTGFIAVGSPQELQLVGATDNSSLSEKIPLPVGAICTVTANPSLQQENFAALRPTGTTPTRTPYTYFLASDGSNISVSGDLIGGTNSWITSVVNVGPGTEVEVNTASVTDMWKTHSLTFEVANAMTSYDINIVHSYDIDTRDIVVTKEAEGQAMPGETYNFQYSIDGGTNWNSDPTFEITDGGSFTIADIPLINSTTLSPISVLVREEVDAPANGGPDVVWNVNGTNLIAATPEHDGNYARSSAFEAGLGITSASTTTPDLALKVINAYPVTVDFEAMLPATGVKTLVWVLGLGLVVALGALALFVISRRK